MKQNSCGAFSIPMGRVPQRQKERCSSPLRDVDLLVWDDLGTGRATEWVGETIRTILNYRYTYNKQTVLSYQLATETLLRSAPLGVKARARRRLLKELAKRLFSRIMEMCEIVEIEGPDFRTEIHKARLGRPQSGRSRTRFNEQVEPKRAN